MKYELDILIRTENAMGCQRTAAHEPSVAGKILLSCSVHEASFLLRLMVEAKVIVNANTTQVFRQVINSFTVPKSPDIKLGSFKNKYYEPAPATIEKVKVLLMDLFNLARKY